MVAIDAAGGDASDASDASEAGADDALRALSERLRITEVTLTQGVEIALTRGETVVEPRNAPVIIGRRGLVRLFVEPVGGAALAMTARLEFTTAMGTAPAPVEAQVQVAAASQRGVLGTTFDFALDAASLDATTSISIALQSADAPGSLRWPSTGTLPLRAQDAGPALQLRYIPLQLHGVLPATDEAHLALYRGALMDLFPIADLRTEVAAPLVLAGDLRSFREWDAALQLVRARRAADAPPDPVIYVGLVATADPGLTGIGGIAADGTMGGPSDHAMISLAVGADGSVARAPQLVAHELAHVLGRLHGPCGSPAGVDPAYPYADGVIGTWGWSASVGRLRDPRDYHDVMTYCTPQWVSDYTYTALFNRLAVVNSAGGM